MPTRCCARLELDRHFEDVFDIVAAELEPKPSPQTYDRFLAAHGVDAGKAAMFEDLARNLAVPHALGMTTVLVVPEDTREVFREDWELEGRDAPHVDHVTDDLVGFLRSDRSQRLTALDGSRPRNDLPREHGRPMPTTTAPRTRAIGGLHRRARGQHARHLHGHERNRRLDQHQTDEIAVERRAPRRRRSIRPARSRARSPANANSAIATSSSHRTGANEHQPERDHGQRDEDFGAGNRGLADMRGRPDHHRDHIAERP